jgi:hypothetical protein
MDVRAYDMRTPPLVRRSYDLFRTYVCTCGPHLLRQPLHAGSHVARHRVAQAARAAEGRRRLKVARRRVNDAAARVRKNPQLAGLKMRGPAGSHEEARPAPLRRPRLSPCAEAQRRQRLERVLRRGRAAHYQHRACRAALHACVCGHGTRAGPCAAKKAFGLAGTPERAPRLRLALGMHACHTLTRVLHAHARVIYTRRRTSESCSTRVSLESR